MTIVGIVAAGTQTFITMRYTPAQPWPLPQIDMTWTLAAIGGVVGVLISTALLRLGVFTYSFADYEQYVKDDEPIAEYPHARREMLKEILFLLPIISGCIIGFILGYEKGNPSPFMLAIGGSLLGYLVGGGLVWGIRIFGTLGFGREAMGLGDVHLLAGIGAILGCWDPLAIFFIAPFSGLLYAATTAVLVKIGKKHREIPYGPHLAVATLIVLLCRPVVDWTWAKLAPSATQQQSLQIDMQLDDLTNGVNVDPIPITTTSRWNRSVKQDVTQARWLIL